jgi:hypothetical protein
MSRARRDRRQLLAYFGVAAPEGPPGHVLQILRDKIGNGSAVRRSKERAGPWADVAAPLVARALSEAH